MTSRWLTRLNAPRAGLWAAVLVPLAFGLVSLSLGADRNFDLLNYHLYNAYAFLHGRLDMDLAPAGMQSYFNPLADLPYYGLSMHAPAWLTGFLMGVLHGLNFILVLFIARRALPGLSAERRYVVPLLLALAGCLTANFLSELGNSMNDNSLALLELGALCLLFAGWAELGTGSRRAVGVLLLAGLLAGAGAGLKLTNAAYALAFALGFFFVPMSWAGRLRLAVLFGVGVLAGLGLAGGFWYREMWQHFHNPLFPQFSAFFPSPLARPIRAADTQWLPHNLLEVLFWPFVIAANSHRVGQIGLHQVVWPVLYLLFILWGVQRLRHRIYAALDPRQRYLLAAIGIGFLLWMLVFGVYRYLVPIELLAPLAACVLCMHLFPPARAPRIAGWVVGICTAVVLLGGCRTWGHEARAEPLFSAEVPTLDAPASTTVLLVGAAKPYAWLAPLFPEEVSFVGAHQDFPESRIYRAKVHEMAGRGPAFAVVEAHFIWRLDSIARANDWAATFGLTSSPGGCALLRKAGSRFQLHANVIDAPGGCRMQLAPGDEEDTVAEDHASAEQAAHILDAYGLALDPATCRVYMARVGAGSYPYQWCPLGLAAQRRPPPRKGRV